MSKREHRYEFGAWTLITGDKPVVEVRLGIGYADGATQLPIDRSLAAEIVDDIRTADRADRRERWRRLRHYTGRSSAVVEQS